MNQERGAESTWYIVADSKRATCSANYERPQHPKNIKVGGELEVTAVVNVQVDKESFT